MNKKLACYILLSAFVLSGCATTDTAPLTAEQVSNKAVFDIDSFTKVTHVMTPIYGNSVSNVRLISTYRRKEKLYTGIYVFEKTPDWVFYESATDINGNDLEFDSVSREVLSDGRVNEQFRLSLSQEYLKKHELSGITFKAYGSKGSKVFYVPSAYVSGFLKSVATYDSFNR